MNNIFKIQSHLLKGLQYIHDLCEQNDLNYYLIGGSALGAERHTGFIPWDDDVDIGVPRDDYNKFLKLLISSKNKKYFLQNNETDPEYYLCYSKLRINDTTYREKYYQDAEIHHGLSIDIFPLDKVGKKTFISKLKFTMIKVIQTLILFKYKNYNKRTLVIAMFFFPLLLLSKKKLLNSAIKMLKPNESIENPLYLVNFFGRYHFDKEKIDMEIFGKPKLKKFEDTLLYVPQNNDKYLKNLYGNYMKLPPVHLRETHSPIEIKL